MRRALILGYHRVVTSPRVDLLGRDLAIATSRFRRHMEILARRFKIVPLDELVAQLAERAQGPHVAAVTFDDGYADNYHCAFPVLSHLGIPATIFLATEFVEHGRPFWWDRLAWYLCRRAGAVLPLPDELGGQADLTSVAGLRQTYRTVLGTLRALDDGDAREAFLDALGAERPPDGRPLTWEEVRSMHRQGITFGAHTATHPSLPAISDAALSREIEASNRSIVARLQAHATMFAYPFGDVAERVDKAVTAAGFRGAVTTRAGLCGPRTSAALLPRLIVDDWDAREFLHHLDRFGTAPQRARRFALSLKARIPPRAAAIVKSIRPWL
jgi:peptidoglycan/xylan/chitin deacetylase (PgdA/CDA1 family)